MLKVSMNTKKPDPSLDVALGVVPSALRARLIKAYTELKTAALENQHDTVGLRAGKLAELLLRVVQQLLTQTYVPLGQSLGNFKAQCEQLENTPKTAGPESIRIIVPRALSFLYTLRNKRDIGHVGGDVEANEIDAATAVRISDWCVCELIRAYHNMPLEEAQNLCDAIAERSVPMIWSVLGKRRVLDPSLSFRDQTLYLLYSEIEKGVPTEDLLEWTEHPNRSNYRRDVLSRLHKERLIEWDKETEMAIISPTGIADVEERLLKIRK